MLKLSDRRIGGKKAKSAKPTLSPSTKLNIVLSTCALENGALSAGKTHLMSAGDSAVKSFVCPAKKDPNRLFYMSSSSSSS